jgi:outer membrane protein assembly factor BamE (lipoprotein component of BamABCDE complex)
MKKLISIVLVAFAISLSMTACTEEEVTPSSEIVNSGKPLDPK